MNQPLRLAAFISGGGSNLQAIIDAIEAGQLNARVVLCIGSTATAGGLERARKHGIPVAVMPLDAQSDAKQAAFLLDSLRELQADFIVLAGYLKRIPDEVVRAFRGRMLNIHPALLPAFGGKGMYGRRVHQAVLDYGARWTGVTVHLVDEEYDSGPVVLQQPVPVHQDDTPETLAARVLDAEHRIYVEALKLFAERRIRLEGRLVRILPQTTTTLTTEKQVDDPR